MNQQFIPEEIVEIERRSKAYLAFSVALDYPDDALLEWVKSGAFSDIVSAVLNVPENIQLGLLLKSVKGIELDAQELGSMFNHLFLVGAGGKPPCSLYGGQYGVADRIKVMEEVLRFYNLFGLTLNPDQRDMPDYLPTQLEFLHFLTLKQQEMYQANGDATPFIRAEKDFLERHPCRWVPTMRENMQKLRPAPSPFYEKVVELLDEYLKTLP